MEAFSSGTRIREGEKRRVRKCFFRIFLNLRERSCLKMKIFGDKSIYLQIQEV